MNEVNKGSSKKWVYATVLFAIIIGALIGILLAAQSIDEQRKKDAELEEKLRILEENRIRHTIEVVVTSNTSYLIAASFDIAGAQVNDNFNNDLFRGNQSATFYVDTYLDFEITPAFGWARVQFFVNDTCVADKTTTYGTMSLRYYVK